MSAIGGYLQSIDGGQQPNNDDFHETVAIVVIM
jgi:hypothetical protein